MKSYFASPERNSLKELRSYYDVLVKEPLADTLFNLLPGFVLLLSAQRQIVMASEGLLQFLGKTQLEQIFGKRPGEIFSCIHAQEHLGCGTTEACQFCGAVNAIIDSSKHGQKVQREVRMLVHGAQGTQAQDFDIIARQFTVKEHSFTLLNLVDISNYKRRQILERIFYHDIRNTVGGLMGLSDLLLKADDVEETVSIAEIVHQISKQLLGEIADQQCLIQAEAGDLQAEIIEIDLIEIAKEVLDTMRLAEVSKHRTIRVLSGHDRITIKSDPILVRRVLTNMVKNALEAIPIHAEVQILVEYANQDQAGFMVKNPGHIPHEVAIQIFQRSYTTKGTGRGLGTYSMKLIGEQYLHGKIEFASTPNEGTVFKFWLPL